MPRLPAYFSCSLREILLFAAFAGIGLAALKSGGLLAALVQALSLILVIAVAVAAIVEGREARMFAAGFFVAAGAYAGLLIWHGEAEFDPARGGLFTSLAFEPLYETVKRDQYYDIFRDFIASPEDAAELSSLHRYPPEALDLQASHYGMTEADRVVKTQYNFYRYEEIPDRREFMTVAHLLVAMTLGYASGKFAVALHRRKERREAVASSATPDVEQAT